MLEEKRLKLKKVEIKTETVVDIICDICNKSCIKSRNTNTADDVHSAEYSTLLANWGYYSKKDGEKWEFQFCEECSDKLYKFINEKSNF